MHGRRCCGVETECDGVSGMCLIVMQKGDQGNLMRVSMEVYMTGARGETARSQEGIFSRAPWPSPGDAGSGGSMGLNGWRFGN